MPEPKSNTPSPNLPKYVSAVSLALAYDTTPGTIWRWVLTFT